MHGLSLFFVALALSIMLTGTAVAAPDGVDTQTTEVRSQEEGVEDDDDGFDWGLLGLLGLAGLAGLLRRPRTAVRTTPVDTTSVDPNATFTQKR